MQLTGLLLRKLFRLPQTYLMILGIGLGYLSLVFMFGFRWIVLIIGGFISVLFLGDWVINIKKNQYFNSANLLDLGVFEMELKTQEKKLKSSINPSWDKARTRVIRIQRLAQAVADQEPELIPELVETLHTVLALTEQAIAALVALKQVKTPSYQNLAQQHLKASYDRLRQTQLKLQQLRDQILLTQLENHSRNLDRTLPEGLQLIIEQNQTVLQAFPISSFPSNLGE